MASSQSQGQAAPVLVGKEKQRIAIQDASSWTLRVGVITSVTVMLIGLVLSFIKGNLTQRYMETAFFSDNFSTIGHGVVHLDAFAWMELGILLLVLTPVLRVFTAMVLFAFEEHDLLYTFVTFLVLLLTLGALLFIK